MAKLSKTQKKIDNTICKVLTDVCEQALKDYEGFAWITHQADYANFPASLFITCVFEREEHLSAIATNGVFDSLRKTIHAKLLKAGIKLMQGHKQVNVDSEEACHLTHDGNWSERLNERKGRALSKSRPG